MRHLRFILFLGILATPIAVWADTIETGDDPAPITNKLMDFEAQRRNEASRGLLSQRGEFTGAGKEYGQSVEETINLDAGSFCAEDDEACKKKYIFDRAGKLLGSHTAFNSMAGFSDITNAPVMAEQLVGLLGNPVTVANVTWMLTEPAVAGGLANTASFGQAALQNMYLSEQIYFEHARANPETGPIVLALYQNCIAQKLKEERSGGRIPWVEAQSQCMGGARNNSDGFAKFQNATGVARLKDDPNHPSKFADLGVTRDDNKISVFDYLFNQLYGRQGDGEKKSVVKELRASMEQLIPDGLLSIGTLDDDPNPSKKTGVLPIAIEPVNGPGYQGPEVIYRDLATANYTTINQLMYMYCQFNNNPKAEGDNSMGQWRAVKNPKFEDGYFWADERVTSRMDKVSAAELQMSPGLVQALYAPFEAEERAGRAGAPSRNCSRLEVWKDTNSASIEKILGGHDGSITTLVSDRVRTYYYLARRLALLQLLATYIEAERLVFKLSGGPYDSVIRNYALTQIYDAAGTQDLTGTYKRLVGETTEYLTDYFNRYENTIASSGAALTAGLSSKVAGTSAGGS